MKNRVRMSIDRDLHAWFKSQEGETNDERMSRLHYVEFANEMNKATVKSLMSTQKGMERTIKYLASALVVSISISCLAVGYVAKLQGWF